MFPTHVWKRFIRGERRQALRLGHQGDLGELGLGTTWKRAACTTGGTNGTLPGSPQPHTRASLSLRLLRVNLPALPLGRVGNGFTVRTLEVVGLRWINTQGSDDSTTLLVTVDKVPFPAESPTWSQLGRWNILPY